MSLNNLGCLSKCLYTDTNNILKYLTIKLVSILANHKDFKESTNFPSDLLIFTNKNTGYLKPLNN